MKIESIKNSVIKEIYKLKEKKNRYINKRFIAEGERVIKTFIESGLELIYYLHTEDVDPILKKSIEKTIIITEEIIKKISSVESPSGHLAVFLMPIQEFIHLTPGIVAAKINDPGNLGTLLRSTAAFGFETAVLVESCDPWSSKVVQSSAGALAKLKIYFLQWSDLVKQAKHNNIKLIALVVDKGENIAKISNSLIVIGNEANGIPDLWLKDCLITANIPMKNSIESLNAAVAGSIALYLMASNN